MKRNWNTLNWNIRGINDNNKWFSIANKIAESNADIICLQGTKKEFFTTDISKTNYPGELINLILSPRWVHLVIYLQPGMIHHLMAKPCSIMIYLCLSDSHQ